MAGVVLLAQVQFRVLAPGFPLWAYGYKTPPAAPEDWSGRCPGTRPRDCDRPGGMPADTTGVKLTIPGSGRFFTVAEITSPHSPAEWFPEDHPNGQGLMQNGPVAGLPVDHFLRQLADFASGRRRSADVNKGRSAERTV